MERVPNDILAVLRRAGLLEFGDEPDGEPLTGGVSSDIWRVRAGRRVRSASSGRWPSSGSRRTGARRSSAAATRPPGCGSRAAIVPAAVPELLFEDRAAGAAGHGAISSRDRYRLWKAGRCATARPIRPSPRRSGRRLGRIHAATARRAGHRGAVPDRRHLPRHPARALSARHRPRASGAGAARCGGSRGAPPRPSWPWSMATSARRTSCSGRTARCSSTPNAPGTAIPAFDLAFCLNHLLLKCLWTPAAAPGFLGCFDALAGELSATGVVWEPRDELEARAASLLPGLFLARVDGKSPVEYVTDVADKERVRRVAGAFLLAPPETLAADSGGLGRGAGAVSRTAIERVLGRRVWDSRGRPTVEAEMQLAGGAGRPGDRPGRCLDRHAARRVDLRDGGEAFGGHGRHAARSPTSARSSRRRWPGMDAADQAAVDARLIELDGTPRQAAPRRQRHDRGLDGGGARRGGRGRAAAVAPSRRATRRCTLPLPEIQIFGGGAHAAGRLDIQDFLVVCPGAASFAQALDWTAEVYRAAGQPPGRAGPAQGRGRRGRLLAGARSATRRRWTMLARGDRAGRLPARASEVAIALDVAASQFGRDGPLPAGPRRPRARHRRR